MEVVTHMGKKSKRYRASLEKQPKTPLPLEDAVESLKKYDSTKFDQTVEIHMWLGVDPNQADQIIRGSLVLPNGRQNILGNFVRFSITPSKATLRSNDCG